MPQNEDPRKTAVRLLCRLEETSAYSNILLDEYLRRSKLDERDKSFCTALFYGTLERRYTLDMIIRAYSDKPSQKQSAEVRNILRTALYQIIYMDSVPDHAAVDEAVKLAAKERNPAAKGFVNALLRAYLRGERRVSDHADKADALAYEYSAPPQLVNKWLDEYGEKTARSLLSSSIGRPPVTAKVNTLKTTSAQLVELLADEGIRADINAYFDDCINIRGGSPEAAHAFEQGLFHVQDISSRICCSALDAKAGMTVLDICGAPGGKTFTIAELMDNKGRLLSFDLHKKRAGLIAAGAKRLGLDIVTAEENDGKVFCADIPQADAVLCDVPCSGLGVIRRKPEIKYRPLDGYSRLPEAQYKILECSSKYVKIGGVLVYSTCTLSRAENDETVDRFFAENPQFEPSPIAFTGSPRITILPSMYDSDGFFIAKAVRTR